MTTPFSSPLPHRHPRPHPSIASQASMTRWLAWSCSSAAAPKRRHLGCGSALEQITLTPLPRGDCIRDTCNYEIWRVMKGESMSPRRELQRWTRHHEHRGESHRVKSFSVHPREIAFCRNESEENRDVLRSEEDAPTSLGSQLRSEAFFSSLFLS